MKTKKISEFPQDTRSILERLVKQGYIEVTKENKIAISDEMALILLILDRAGIFN